MIVCVCVCVCVCVEDEVGGWGGGEGGNFSIVEKWPFIRVGPTGLTESFYDGDSDCSN